MQNDNLHTFINTSGQSPGVSDPNGNKRTKDGEAEHKFEEALKELGIIQVKSRPHHPQTNGKNERWFGIYKQEYDERFENFGEFVFWYNNERLSEAIGYKTPAEIYLAEVNV